MAKSTKSAKSPTVTTRVRFYGESVSAYADAQGVVRVWDSVAGHYTVCHHLSPGQMRYVRARATRA